MFTINISFSLSLSELIFSKSILMFQSISGDKYLLSPRRPLSHIKNQSPTNPETQTKRFKRIKFSNRSWCHKQIFALRKLCDSEIVHSDWFREVTWLGTSNQSALFQWIVAMLLYFFAEMISFLLRFQRVVLPYRPSK